MADSIRQMLIQEWSTGFVSAAAVVMERRPDILHVDSVPASAAGDVEAFQYSYSHAAEAVLVIAASPQDWTLLGTLVLQAAGLENSSAEDARSTCLELLGQATSRLSQVLSSELGESVTFGQAASVTLPGGWLTGDTSINVLEVTLSESSRIRLYLAASPTLASAILSRTAGAALTLPQSSGPVIRNTRTLELLMEVELPVSVSFGRAQLQLRDVLKLNSGSIVELNRTITEPVEVIVNNCVVARGEVVVVDGNYGIRISHVVSREERLRALN